MALDMASAYDNVIGYQMDQSLGQLEHGNIPVTAIHTIMYIVHIKSLDHTLVHVTLPAEVLLVINITRSKFNIMLSNYLLSCVVRRYR